VERLLLVAGAALLAFYGVARFDGWLGSRAALRAFDRASVSSGDSTASPSAPAPGGHAVDVSLWSPERVRAFEASLSLTEDRALAVLEMDQPPIRVPVFEGTDDLALNRGAGWIPGTARPGADGNVAIAAHRDGFFRLLMYVREGDPIRLRVADRTRLYRVDSTEIVEPENVSVLMPRAVPSLTLVTCYPFYYVGSAPQRYIVHATLESEGGNF
jgi:sortase A